MLKNLDPNLRQCIEDCNNCYRSCVTTITHCLTKGGKHAELKHIALLKDCAALCKLGENFMLRESDFYKKVCQLCAEICERCAENCETVAPEDEKMKECADMCRKCAASCKKM